MYENREEELEFTRAYIESMYRFYGYGIWLVCLKDTDEIIGRAGLSNRLVDEESKLELGYVIGEKYQKQGYAFEACTAVCEFARRELYAEEIVCFIERKNTVSIHLAEKLGFRYIEDICAEDGKVFEYYIKEV